MNRIKYDQYNSWKLCGVYIFQYCCELAWNFAYRLQLHEAVEQWNYNGAKYEAWLIYMSALCSHCFCRIIIPTKQKAVCLRRRRSTSSNSIVCKFNVNTADIERLTERGTLTKQNETIFGPKGVAPPDIWFIGIRNLDNLVVTHTHTQKRHTMDLILSPMPDELTRLITWAV